MATNINSQKGREEEKVQMRSCALPAGTVLRGKSGREYKITGVLGAGGFGITYKAVGRVLINKATNYSQMATFAIKEYFMKGCSRGADGAGVLCSASLRGDMEAGRDDFKKEADVLVKLNGESPHIVMVNEQFEANGTWYYVMDYLDGQSLQQHVDALPGHCLTERQALAWLLPVARAVALLHSHHLLHLDIKPDNIMLKHDPMDGTVTPVLIDFGLAKHFDKKGKPTSRLVARGATEGYAPLEQFGNITSFSPGMDIYALGATLYFMLTGKTPPSAYEVFSMSVSAFLQKNLPASVSPQVREAIKRAMQPNVNERTQTVEEFVEALEDKKSQSPLPVGYVLHGDFANYAVTEVVHSMPVCFVYKARLIENSWNAGVPPYVKQAGTAYYVYEWFIREDGVQLERDGYNAFFHPDMQETECLKEKYTEEMFGICADERLDDGSLRERAFRSGGDDYVCWSYFHENIAEMFTPDCKAFDEQNNCLCDYFYVNNTSYVACPIDSQAGNGGNASGVGVSGGETDTFGRETGKRRIKKKVMIGAACLLACFIVYRVCMFLSLPEEPVDYSSLPIPELTEKAEEGIAEAQFYLGIAYQQGKDVIQNDSIAAYWFKQAAEKGEVAAQHNLGVAYLEGKGVPKDCKMAVFWFKQAADKGLLESQNNLGTCYSRGEGVSQNDSIAVVWYKRAAEQGHATAQFNLGICYKYGSGVSQNDSLAVVWLKKAAEQGQTDAQRVLKDYK